MQKLIVILRDAKWLEPDRILRIAIVFAAVELVALAIEWWLQAHGKFPAIVGTPFGEDFANYWAGARLAFRGHVITVYDPVAFFEYEQSHIGPFSMFRWYAYPPVALLLCAPLALFPYVPAYAFWLVSGTGLCALLFSKLMRWPMALLAAVAMPAVFFNMVSGQNGQFTAVLFAGALMLLDPRPILSGLLFGLLCYKPHLGIVIPFALIAGGRWRTFFSAAFTVAVLVGATLMLFGWDGWIAYFHAAPMRIGQLISNQGQTPDSNLVSKSAFFVWYGMPTVYGALRLAGEGSATAYAGQLLSALSALVITIMVWRGTSSLPVKSAALVVATFLITPYAWSYDLVVLTFAIVWLWQEAALTEFYPFEKSLLAGTLAMTLLYGVLGKVTHLSVMPILLWILLLFAQKRARASATRTAMI